MIAFGLLLQGDIAYLLNAAFSDLLILHRVDVRFVAASGRKAATEPSASTDDFSKPLVEQALALKGIFGEGMSRKSSVCAHIEQFARLLQPPWHFRILLSCSKCNVKERTITTIAHEA